jgi:hypothetical protein
VAISTYAELATELSERTHGAADANRVAASIALATARFSRELRVPEMEALAYTSTSTEWTALPLDYMELRSISIANVPLAYATPFEIQRMEEATYRPVKPKYTIADMSFRVWPVPSAATIEILYFQKIPAITSGTDTNWLLGKYPDAYVQACMEDLTQWAKDFESMTLHAQYVAKFINDMKRRSQTIQFGASPLAIRPY